LGIWWLLGEYVALVGVILAAWAWWPEVETTMPVRAIGWGATILAVIVFNARGASAIIEKVLMRLKADEQNDEGPEGAGNLIGMLERWMIIGLVCVGQWGAVGLVLTAKSIARFKRMDEQAFAEIYLVGTMTSVLIAMMSGGLLLLVLK
jgi:hypothetical protein